MALILNIDTAVQTASVCLAKDGDAVAVASNPSQQESAAWLHTAIRDLLLQHNRRLNELEAVAVSAGPGSYTGLRVGMAAAKGLCFALSVPLLTVPTLQMMAAAARRAAAADQLLCPLIDARRMEVFTALYNGDLEEVLPASNLVLDDASFALWLQKHPILFFGSGAQKAEPFIRHPNARFGTIEATAPHMAQLAEKQFQQERFADLAYAEPFYGKAVYTPAPKKNG